MLKELDNKDTQMTAGNATGYTSELSEKLPSPELTCTAVMISALYRFIYFRNSSRQPAVLRSKTPCISSAPHVK